MPNSENVSNIAVNNCVLNDIKGNQINYNTYIDRADCYDERLKIAAWISSLNFKATQLDVFQKRAPNTGQWLLDSREFSAWLVGSSETLWCPGIPGAGKTVLASIVVDHIQTTLMHDNAGIACIYCYCNFKEQKTQTVSELIASLLKQLVQDHPTISDNVKSLYNHHIVRNTRPTPDEFTKALRSEIGIYTKVFIIVDALDEFLECDQGYLITELQSLASTINLMVTSRPLPMIEQQFHGARRLDILANDEDIRKYIESRIPRERRLVQHVKRDGTLLETMTDKIRTTARGMFLLAELHMNTLVSKSNPGAVRNALEHLPTETNATYDEAMERIAGQGEDDKQLAERVLSWIVYAFRPLSLKELQHAMSVYPNMNDIDPYVIEDEAIFISVCAGLVVIDEESRLIHLIHYTAQQYFESKRESLFPSAPAYISTTCLTYLSFDRFQKGYCVDDEELDSLLEKNPLLLYAAVHWGHHTRGCVEETHREMVLDFLQKMENVACASQVMLTRQDRRYSRYSQWFPRGVSGIHLLSFFGLEKILLHQLKNGARVDLMDEYGRAPLWYAARNGHEAVVRLLVGQGDVKDTNGRTPLSIATDNGHEAVVRLLTLRNDVDVNSQDKYGRSPLSYAAETGHKGIMELLLARHDVQANSNSTTRRSPISYAAANGHDQVVGQLIERNDVDVNSRDSTGGSPLSWAAQCGHKAVVMLLVARDEIELNYKDEDGNTALLWAARNGHEEVVRLLLAKVKIGVNSRDSTGGSPLSWAAMNGHEEVVRLLVARDDIKLNCKNRYGHTPLSLAAKEGHEPVVRLLLAKAKIDANSRGSGGSPLLWAARNGREEVVRLLVTRDETELNYKDEDGNTALLLAASNGNEEVVRLLLAKAKIDVNSRDSTGGSPLLWAACHGREEVVGLLVARDEIELNYKDDDGNTALLWAAYKGNEEVVRLLLVNAKIDVNSRDSDGYSPLSWAAKRGHEAVVRLLVARDDIELNCKDSDGETPLSLAAKNGYEEVVTLIREAERRLSNTVN